MPCKSASFFCLPLPLISIIRRSVAPISALPNVHGQRVSASPSTTTMQSMTDAYPHHHHQQQQHYSRPSARASASPPPITGRRSGGDAQAKDGGGGPLLPTTSTTTAHAHHSNVPTKSSIKGGGGGETSSSSARTHHARVVSTSVEHSPTSHGAATSAATLGHILRRETKREKKYRPSSEGDNASVDGDK